MRLLMSSFAALTMMVLSFAAQANPFVKAAPQSEIEAELELARVRAIQLVDVARNKAGFEELNDIRSALSISKGRVLPGSMDKCGEKERSGYLSYTDTRYYVCPNAGLNREGVAYYLVFLTARRFSNQKTAYELQKVVIDANKAQ